jgi:hypothetical protein
MSDQTDNTPEVEAEPPGADKAKAQEQSQPGADQSSDRESQLPAHVLDRELRSVREENAKLRIRSREAKEKVEALTKQVNDLGRSSAKHKARSKTRKGEIDSLLSTARTAVAVERAKVALLGVGAQHDALDLLAPIVVQSAQLDWGDGFSLTADLGKAAKSVVDKLGISSQAKPNGEQSEAATTIQRRNATILTQPAAKSADHKITNWREGMRHDFGVKS